jgi:hypothetical protein
MLAAASFFYMYESSEDVVGESESRKNAFVVHALFLNSRNYSTAYFFKLVSLAHGNVNTGGGGKNKIVIVSDVMLAYKLISMNNSIEWFNTTIEKCMT